MKSHFILDLDGVLIDSIQTSIPKLQDIALELGLPIDKQFKSLVRSLWGKNLDAALIPALTKKYGWDHTRGQRLLQLFLERDQANPAPLIADSIPALTQLTLMGELSVITNRNQKSWETLLRPDLLAKEWFRFVQHADSGLPTKPSPLAMQNIIQLLNGHDVFYIGDSAADDYPMIKAVNKLYAKKITFLGVLSGVSTKKDFLNEGLEEKLIFKNLFSASYFLMDCLTS
jgi:phosphoglycolate phosphatase-like HAD superfamily hydrolase